MDAVSYELGCLSSIYKIKKVESALAEKEAELDRLYKLICTLDTTLTEKETENAAMKQELESLREKVRHQENLIFALEEEKEYAEIARRDFEREIYKQCDIEDVLRAAVEKPGPKEDGVKP